MLNTIPITDLKQNLAKIVRQVKSSQTPIYVMQRSKATAVILDVDQYQAIEKALEDKADLEAIKQRIDEERIDSQEVANKLGLA